MTHPWFAATATPRILAHRGLVPHDAEGVVENTVAAFAAAHAGGAVYVESDCHLTADGVPILFHDEDLNRVAGDPRRIADVRFVELEQIMASRGGLLTVGGALQTFPTLRFNLDVKVATAAAPVGAAIARYADRVLVSSFDDRRRRAALAAARAAGGEPATSAGRTTIVQALLAVSSRSRRAVRHALAGIDALQIPERQGPVRIVTPRLVDAAHEAGVEVHVWTVNDTADMTRLLDLGVDGLVTDRADAALKVVAARG